MPHIFIKSLKPGLWVVLALIFTSSSSIEEKPDKKMLAAGSYVLNIEWERQLKLERILNFETIKKCSPKGKEYAISIDDIDDRIIKGSINVVFENPNDEIVGLDGEFSAFRK